MIEKYLPIGTVVTLKNGNKKLVISGYKSSFKDKSEIFDYMGILYPEGLGSTDNIYLFNHEDIDLVNYMGYKRVDYKVLSDLLIKNDEDESRGEVNE